MTVRVQPDPFDLGAESAAFAAGAAGAGAVVTFTGVVRGDDDLTEMEIEHYPAMAERAVAAIRDEAVARWNLADALVIHRHGPMRPGDLIMMVATAARHRGDAFAAAEFLMDYLKSRAPFWKKERRAEGESWVAARAEDEAALDRWPAGAAAEISRNDDAYANAPHIPDGDTYPERWAEAAEAYRRGAIGRELAYGRTERERMDLFAPGWRTAGLVVFVHGGFWRAFDRRTWSHLAAGAVARGWAVAIPSYTLAPDARISEITRQIAAAIDCAAAEVGGPIRLVGHSAGGHLVARMLMEDVPLDAAERLAGCVPISPLADLGPLIDIAMNDDLRLDAEEARRESPALHPRARDVPTTVWVGGAERPAFLDQARQLSEAWSVPLVVDEGRHHFDVVEALSFPDTPLTRTVIGEDPDESAE